jgi:protein-disulfide isomerase
MIHEQSRRAWRRAWFGLIALLIIVVVVGGCAMPLILPAEAPEVTPAAEDAEAAEQPTAATAENATPLPTVDPATEQTSEQTSETQTQAEPATPAEVASAVETYKDLPVGFTAEGYPYRGVADAPVTIYEYSDFQCPFCSRYFVQTEPAVDESFVRTNQVRIVFRDFPLVQLHPNAPAAHVAALCIAEQGSAADFWTMHDHLFETQTVWSNLIDPQPHLVKLAGELGVDMIRFNDCVASGVMETKIEESLAEGRALGITGTPSFNFVRTESSENYLLVGAQPFEQFSGMLTAIAAGEAPPQAEQPQSEQQGEAQIPFWATTEGLAPDPAKPGYTAAGDQYRGNPNAGVVVIEFSDFQCPYCRRHVEETQPLLDETFVDTDQIFWVFKHFPLNFHPQAEAAGVAAECAADQGKFWEMHDLLFTNVEQWSVSEPSPTFHEFATQLALETNVFDACLADGEVLTRVQSDMQEGAPYVQGTPTFIVLFNGEGRIIPGALPADQFTDALQQVVDMTGQSQ